MTVESLAYIPLHVRSCYSINDGLQNVGPIVKRAQKLGIPAIAVTDFNNMAGFVRFYSACKAAGIKPIMGADLLVREKLSPVKRSAFLPSLSSLWIASASKISTIFSPMLE